MTYQDILMEARRKMAPKCKVCNECNGIACRGIVPGPAGKGLANTFQRNYRFIKDNIKIHMDVMGEHSPKDTSVILMGKTFTAPIFVAPIGLVGFNYTEAMDEDTYAQAVVAGAKMAGTAAFTGGGIHDKCFYEPLKVIEKNNGWGIPTLKPWKMDVVQERIKILERSGAFAFAMDIDSAGLSHANMSVHPMEAKSEADIASIVSMTNIPFIVKGIMTPQSALKAAKAGVYAIVVSNHGGRVLDDGLSTAEVLPEIKKAVGNSVKIFIDGGIRTGSDVFKMLALGADAVLIGRPYAIAAYGGEAEGVKLYTEKLIQELKDTMVMTNCGVLADISKDKVILLH